jgi:hypothetical protein
MSDLDAKFDGSIFRKDHRIILSGNRVLASILGIRVAYNSSDLLAGTVLARNTTSGLYQPYVLSGASGTGTAACVLFEDKLNSDFASSADNLVARGIFGGEVFQAKLIGLDSGAISDLKARQIVDAAGDQILKF